nr:MAG TPA: N-lysine methyltransferase SMYD2 [Caudoviricetes sp.]
MEEVHEFIGQYHFCKCERCQTAETFPAGTVNVAHHQVHVILCHVIERALALRADFPDVFVVPLTVRFLP